MTPPKHTAGLRGRKLFDAHHLIARTLMAATVLLLLLLGGGGEVATSDESRDRADQPNFVVIMTDDQALRSMDVMRSTRRLLARRGVTFENSFTTFPLCCPSRASFLTGQHPHNHGVLSNRPPDGGFAGFEDRGTLPVALRRAGYTTGLFGKYFNGYGKFARKHPGFVPPGWSRWHSIAARGYFDYTLVENGRLRRYGGRPRDYLTDVLARKATSFIGRASRRGSPFFAFVPLHSAHTEGPTLGEAPNPRPAPRHARALRGRQFQRPPNFNERDMSDKPGHIRKRPRLGPRTIRVVRRHDRDRARSLLAADDAVRKIVRELRASGQLANTYVLFTSDHGFLSGEHRLRGKETLYEEGIRVPLIIRGPGLPRGESVSPLVANIDLAPTILGIAGVEPLRAPDGTDLRPVVESPSDYAQRDLFFAYFRAQGVRTREHMYVEHDTRRGTAYELYDLVGDPFQLENLVDPSSGELREADPELDDVLGALRVRLDELRDCQGTSGPNSCQ